MKITLNEMQFKALLEYESKEKLKQNYEKMKETGFWGEAGSGCIIISKDTGRLLIPQRSQKVQEPGTWGTWGGAIDDGEEPIDAVAREVREEAGYVKATKIIPLHTYENPNGFKYYNFLVLVDEEFTPTIDQETSNFGWFYINELPSPLHFGLKGIFNNPNDMDIIMQYASDSDGIED